MVKQIRSFSNQCVGIFILGCNNRFRGFFANFFQDFVETLSKQVSSVGAVRSFAFAGFDELIKIAKYRTQLRLGFLSITRRRVLEFVVEAGLCTGVTGWALGHYQNPNRIVVTIHRHIDDTLFVARGLALVPQTGSRARPEPCFIGFERAF